MRAIAPLAATAILALTAACSRATDHGRGRLQTVGHDAAKDFHKLAAEAKVEAHKLAADTRGAAHDVTRHDRYPDDHNS